MIWKSVLCPFHDDNQNSASISEAGFICHAGCTEGKVINLEEYKNKKARVRFLERYHLPASASDEEITDAMAREWYGLPSNASKEEIMAAEEQEYEEMKKEQQEGWKKELEQHLNSLPFQE